jgi:hypothetical protein
MMKYLSYVLLGLLIPSFFYLNIIYSQFLFLALMIVLSLSEGKKLMFKSLDSKLFAVIVAATLITTLFVMKKTSLPVKETFEQNKNSKKKETKLFTAQEFAEQKNIQQTEIDQGQYKKISNLKEEEKKTKTLKVKNALLLKKNLVETMNEIIDDFSNIKDNTGLTLKELEKLGIFDSFMLYFRLSMQIITKEHRMIYVGLISLMLSVILTFVEITL